MPLSLSHLCCWSLQPQSTVGNRKSIQRTPWRNRMDRNQNVNIPRSSARQLQPSTATIIIIIIITTTIFIVLSSTAPDYWMREFTVVHLGQSRSAPGGRQLVGQTANLTFESACRLLQAEHSPIATMSHIHVSPSSGTNRLLAGMSDWRGCTVFILSTISSGIFLVAAAGILNAWQCGFSIIRRLVPVPAKNFSCSGDFSVAEFCGPFNSLEYLGHYKEVTDWFIYNTHKQQAPQQASRTCYTWDQNSS